ncbi:MAG TPA: glycosyltransferase [Armatimonadota bacterium]|jgi:hypothetical protein
METSVTYPPLRLAHLRTLTNNSGIIQHGWYSMPNEQTGYCTDDNCRAFLAAVQAYRRLPDPELLRLIGIYLSFIRAARNDQGRFRNFMSYQQFFLDDEGSEDCQGRTLWALGYALRYSPHERVTEIARDLFDTAFCWLPELQSARGRAYSLLGLRNYTQAFPDDPRARRAVVGVAESLYQQFETYATEKWQWFEGRVTYALGIPPLALLTSFETTGDIRFRDRGLKTLDWLTGILVRDGVMVPIGCTGWYAKGRKRHDWDQQGIDPAGMAAAYLAAFRVTGDPAYKDLARVSLDWFHGGNLLGVPLVDPITGGSADGLTEHGRNENQGAESTLVYYLATMACRPSMPVAL